ncbi:MAG: hypothetical protein Rubg2KO_22520 [Rubricoccaceae bacterium]
MDHFTEEEARQIFARAAEHERAVGDAPPSLSLNELQEIGEAAGLSAQSIETAIADIRATQSEPEQADTFWGAPTTVLRSRVVPGELTDEMWERLVSQLRRTFKTKGITTDVGRAREWAGTRREDSRSTLHVTAVPVNGGVRITLEASKTAEALYLKWVPGVFVGIMLFLLLFGAAQGAFGDPVFWGLFAFPLVFGLFSFFGLRTGYRAWAEHGQEAFDGLLEQFEHLARQKAESPDPPLASPALNLDELEGPPDASSDATRSRTQA